MVGSRVVGGCRGKISLGKIVSGVVPRPFILYARKKKTKAGLSRVHNILSPLRDDRKPFIFQRVKRWIRNRSYSSVS